MAQGALVTYSQVSALHFGLVDDVDVIAGSAREIVDRSDVDAIDLGTLSTTEPCRTCGKTFRFCPGHAGHVLLPPTFIGMPESIRRNIFLHVARAVCHECARLVVGPTMTDVIRSRPVHERWAYITKTRKRCAHEDCEAVQPVVVAQDLTFQVVGNDEWTLRDFYDLFARVPPDACEALGFSATTPGRRLTDLFTLGAVPVTPPAARVALTQSYATTRRSYLKEHMTGVIGAIDALWKTPTPATLEQARYRIAAHQDGHAPASGLEKAPHMAGANTDTLASIYPSKHGIFRRILGGKRQNVCARLTIGPDQSLPLDVVALPNWLRTNLCVPEPVTAVNLAAARQWILQRRVQYVVRVQSSTQHLVGDLAEDEDLPLLAGALQVGDVLERHAMDGDWVLFNRQPTLHTGSIMALRARFDPPDGPKTFTARFNTNLAKAYNADHDGDEMHVLALRSYVARAEAALLMAPTRNLISPAHGGLMFGPIQDFLSSLYRLTEPGRLVPRGLAQQIALAVEYIERPFGVPAASALCPIRRFSHDLSSPGGCSGLVVASFALPADLWYDHGGVRIEAGRIVAGQLSKRTLGGGASSIWRTIADRWDEPTACYVMHAMGALGLRWQDSAGFSIGWDDFDTTIDVDTGALLADVERADAAARARGVSPEEREDATVAVLQNAVAAATARAEATLPRDNALGVCIRSGAKGSMTNAVQTGAFLGQQAFDGGRVQLDRWSRTYTSLPPGHATACARARGFIADSFTHGLQLEDLATHLAAARVGLSDTSVSTADSGHLQRRTTFALGDVVTRVDGSVVDVNGTVLLHRYGGDGLSSARLHVVHHDEGAAATHGRLFSRDVAEVPRGREIRSPIDVEAHARRLLLRPVPSEEARVNLTAMRIPAGVPPDLEAYLRDAARALGVVPISVARRLEADIERAFGRARVADRAPVGLLAALTLSESITQTTLNTFHRTGSGSSRALTGLPRIKALYGSGVCRCMAVIVAPAAGTSPEALVARLSPVTLGPQVPEPPMTPLAKLALARLSKRVTCRHVWRSVPSPIVPDDLPHRLAQVDNGPTLVVGHAVWCAATIPDDVVLPATLERIERADILPSGLVSVTLDGSGLLPDGPARTCLVGLTRAILMRPDIDASHAIVDEPLIAEAVWGVATSKAVLEYEVASVYRGSGTMGDPRHIELLAAVMYQPGFRTPITKRGLTERESAGTSRIFFESGYEAMILETCRYGTTDKRTSIKMNHLLGQAPHLGTGAVELVDPATGESLRVRGPAVKEAALTPYVGAGMLGMEEEEEEEEVAPCVGGLDSLQSTGLL